MKKVRLGIIGAGNITVGHLDGSLKSPDLEVTAICDVNEAQLKKRADQYGIKNRFKNHIDLINCPEVDAVSICTPNSTHYAIAKDVILKGLPYILEKPVTVSYKESNELVKLTNERNVPSMVGFYYRYKSAARYAKWLVKEGHLGTIRHVYAQYLQGWAISEEMEHSWRFMKEFSGTGVLGDLGSHMIDLTRFVVGEFEQVCGHLGTFVTKRKIPGTSEYRTVDVDDYSHFLAALEGGVGAVFSITRDAYGRGNYQRMEIYGTQGALVYMLDEEGRHEDYLEVCIGNVYAQDRQFHRLNIPDRFKSEQMQSFADTCNEKGDNMSASIEDGSISQLVVDCIAKSFETKKWINIKEEINNV